MNIIITGASKGMGKAIAGKFAEQGYTLLLCARNAVTLEATADELQQKYPQSTIHFRATDMSDYNEVAAFGDWCLGIGAPDILVNNTGQYKPGSILTEPEGTLMDLMQVNLFSAYHLTRIIAPAMISEKKGHIFNICSIASLNAYPNGGAYSISKFALLGFSKNLREELKPHHVKVTAVMPGAVYTESWYGSGIDQQRIMEVKDIANLIFSAANLSPQACVEDIIIRPQLGDL